MTIENGAAIVLGARRLAPADVWSAAHGPVHATLDPSPEFRARIEAGARLLRDRLAAGERIYGVTTGFGESVVTEGPAALTDDLAVNLVRFHGCGPGASRDLRDAVRETVRFNDGDRRQEQDIVAVREMIHRRTLPLEPA